jgi:hypothetical protein
MSATNEPAKDATAFKAVDLGQAVKYSAAARTQAAAPDGSLRSAAFASAAEPNAAQKNKFATVRAGLISGNSHRMEQFTQ